MMYKLAILVSVTSIAIADTAHCADVVGTVSGASESSWQTGPMRSYVLSGPTVLVGPSPEEMQRNYPPAAYKAGVSGRTHLGCGVAINGDLTHCSVYGDPASRAIFGAATLKLIKFFKVTPMYMDGIPIDRGGLGVDFQWNAPPKQ